MTTKKGMKISRKKRKLRKRRHLIGNGKNYKTNLISGLKVQGQLMVFFYRRKRNFLVDTHITNDELHFEIRKFGCVYKFDSDFNLLVY